MYMYVYWPYVGNYSLLIGFKLIIVIYFSNQSTFNTS